MPIHGLDMFGPIDNGGQGLKAALALLLDGDMPAIDLENQVLGRSGTRRWCGRETIVLGQYRTDFIRDAFDLRMIIHTPRMPIPLLQILLGFSIAIQCPLFTL